MASVSLEPVYGPSPEDEEERRLRQVHQYLSLRDESNARRSEYQKSNLLEVSKIESPDTALTAFTQLVAWRLDAQRAIVSLVDRNDQFFLAESTQTLDLAETGESDWLWVGCSGSTARGVALCAQTIKAPEPATGYSCFCVTDLSQNPAYNHLPYVKGPPFFKFYCGTPLVTQDGFRIGSLFVIDQSQREEGPTESQINFLGVMAANVMQHLDNQREAERRKRIMIMSKGLAAFTEGKHRIPSEWKKQNHADTGTSTAHAKRIDLRRTNTSEGDSKLSMNTDLSLSNGLQGEKNVTGGCVGKEDGEMQTHASVLARASNLLRESLDVAYTVFLDTNIGGSRVVSSDPADSKTFNSREKTHSTYKNHGTRLKSQPSPVLSFSTSQSSSSSQDDVSSAQFGLMESRMTKRLLKKYPNGHLWSFDRSGHEIIVVDQKDKPTYISSDSENQTRQYRAPSKEASALMISFPGARQVLYAPILDLATSKSICACFAVSKQEVPAFTVEIEVAWLRAFLNNVAVEWDRVSVSIADRQKGDFLSSISHEFRSPLHGILASTELLSDSKLEDSERALCETIQGCGQTLLNTVSHILDYTKVNDFNHHLADTTHQREPSPTANDGNTANAAVPEEKLPSVALFSDVDVASICESAVQAVCVGNAFDRRMSEIQVPHDPGATGRADLYSLPNISPTVSNQKKAVSVILNISPGDWAFHCAPGAIQRILMNLVGNSLKYTKAGIVKIKVDSQTERPSQPERERDYSHITITVTDTGIGISEDFLRYKLFTPFSQESAIAAGTGLGMSMVKKIVQTLEGEISVQSEVDKGTQVIVHFPLTAANATTEPIKGDSSAHQKFPSNAVSLLRAECPDKTVAFYGFENEAMNPLKESVQFYLIEWYHFSTIQDINNADFVIVDETSLDDIFWKCMGDTLPLRIVTLRSTTIRDKNLPSTIHSILKPVGPYGLAKVLLNCWTRLPPGTKEVIVDRQSKHAVEDRKSAGIEVAAAQPTDISGSATIAGTLCTDGRLPEAQQLPFKAANVESTLVYETFPKVQALSTTQPHLLGTQAPSPKKDKKEPEVQVVEVEAEVESSQPQILCVDDNPINLKILQAYLKKLEKRNVKCAENGLEAFKAVESSGRPFDVIFMDLSMPVCDGFESTARIRRLEKQRRKHHHSLGSRASFIIALTGQASSRDQDQAFASGVDKFVTKPMSLSHLKALLRDLELEGKLRGSQADSEERPCMVMNESKFAAVG